MRKLILGVVAGMALLAFPGSALAEHGTTCDYSQTNSTAANAAEEEENRHVNNNNVLGGGEELVIYTGSEGSSGTADTVVGACLNLDGAVAAGGVRFDGGTVEAGVIEDPATGANDPEELDDADFYAIIDGDNDNADPVTGQGDGYVGLSNWETGTRDQECPTTGPDQGTGSNSGGCFGTAPVYAPVPFVACGNTSGNNWDGPSIRDGCDIP